MFKPHEATKEISVKIYQDDEKEDDEMFLIILETAPKSLGVTGATVPEDISTARGPPAPTLHIKH